MVIKIPFNRPYLSGNEFVYMNECMNLGHVSGDGKFTKLSQSFFEKKYNFKKALLTTSCTDALEMASILLEIEKDDEIIAPSFTFVSTVNSFVLRGAKIVFVDTDKEIPNIDYQLIESKITSKTKVILVVHYAGISYEIDKIIEIAQKYNLFVVEDCAQAINSYYKNKPLGSFGHLACFSFHETKNIISGEGGMLVINEKKFIERAEIIREKGTNRTKFFKGEIDKYSWVDIGSSFLPSDLISAFLYAQFENLNSIQLKRKHLWELYFEKLQPMTDIKKFKIMKIPKHVEQNFHMFYLICKHKDERNELINFLKSHGILAVFHYLPLHKSDFYLKLTNKKVDFLKNTDYFSDCIIRLPFYFELKDSDINFITEKIKLFFELKYKITSVR